MTQKPGAVGVAMEPETVHMAGVSERNDTVSPVPAGGGVVVTDDAVNVTGWPTVVSGGWAEGVGCRRLVEGDRLPEAGRPLGRLSNLGGRGLGVRQIYGWAAHHGEETASQERPRPGPAHGQARGDPSGRPPQTGHLAHRPRVHDRTP